MWVYILLFFFFALHFSNLRQISSLSVNYKNNNSNTKKKRRKKSIYEDKWQGERPKKGQRWGLTCPVYLSAGDEGDRERQGARESVTVTYVLVKLTAAFLFLPASSFAVALLFLVSFFFFFIFVFNLNLGCLMLGRCLENFTLAVEVLEAIN